MPGYLEQLFSSNGFMPHGMCYLWRPDLLALHVLADSLIALAYFSIPFSLLYFVRRRKELQFNWVFVCFAIFIVACGTTHLMEIVTIWRPVYWLSGIIKAITALASLPTAVLLVRLVPEALRWPSPAALQRANTSLELGRMASRIAHDVNNALTPATLYTQSLLDHERSLSAQARSDLIVVSKAIEDVTHTLTRIKELYRHPERG